MLEVNSIGPIYPTTNIVFALILAYLTWTAYDVYLSPLSRYPGPKLWAASRVPMILMLFMGDEAHSMRRLHDRYGSVIRVSPTQLSYTDPVAWKDIYSHRIGGRSRAFAKDPMFYQMDASAEKNIATASEKVNGRLRRILAGGFSDKALRQQEALLKQWVTLLISKLKEVELAGEPADVVTFYNLTTFDISSDFTLSEPMNMLENGKYDAWVQRFLTNVRTLGRILALRHLPFMNPVFRVLLWTATTSGLDKKLQFSTDRVKRRLADDPGKNDLFTEILRREKSDEEGMKMSTDEKYMTADVMLLAGSETTSTLLSGLTFHLLRNPATLKKLTQEVREAFADTDAITLDALARLPYLNACIEEGLRIHPPVPLGMPRVVPSEGAVVAGCWVPGNTTVAVHQFATYRSSANFTHPDTFAPERWLDNPTYASDNPAALQPFSLGPRNCIGKTLAYMEIRLVMAMLLWNFDLSLEEQSREWGEQQVSLMWEKKPLMVRLESVKR